jgi:hypothetical protein
MASMALTSLARAQEPESRPAIRIRLSHPERELEDLLGLFREAKAASPAAAMVAWKRASREPNRLGKPIEAMIAALNPRMIPELQTLDAAEVSIRFHPETGQTEWSAILPRDDGTFAALASAFVLSGGMAEAPLEELAVDRLAGTGSPLMARAHAGTLLASDRERLKQARTRLKSPINSGNISTSGDGLEILVEPGAIRSAKSLAIRRLAELISPGEEDPQTSRSIRANLHFEAKSLRTTVKGLPGRPWAELVLDPSWYDSIPRDRVVASYALATDPASKSWDALFALADRIEKLDPARRDVAPIQIRLAILARASGLRLEADLLRHLLGISGWIGSSNRMRINNALLEFHLDDGDAAERIVASLKPWPGSGKAPAGTPDRPRWLGQVDGQPIQIVRSQRDVLLAWGEGVLEASLRARSSPEHSSGGAIREKLKAKRPFIGAGVIWPERLPNLIGAGILIPRKIDGVPPICWSVHSEEGRLVDVALDWDRLDEAVREFLERLPLDAPPDH